MELPENGTWVGFPGDNKRKPGQWFWGRVVSREFRGEKWSFLIDTGSGGLARFCLHELTIPEPDKELRPAIKGLADKLASVEGGDMK